MTEAPPCASVVVGVDGSHAAVHAAEWAVDEAVARDLPLRLIHVTRPGSGRESSDEVPHDIEFSATVLGEACAAIQATGKNVEVDTAVVRGDPTAVLLAESHLAELICVGSTGIGTVSRHILGSKATALAENSACPVAIIRVDAQAHRPDRTWIAVGVTAPDDEDVVIAALAEARLRGASVLAVGLWHNRIGDTPSADLAQMVKGWQQRFPDVHVQPVPTRSGLAPYLEDEREFIDLVVVGAEEAGRVTRLVGPYDHPIFGHCASSVLIVRH